MDRESFVDCANCPKELCAMVHFAQQFDAVCLCIAHVHNTVKLGGDSHRLPKTTYCHWSI